MADRRFGRNFRVWAWSVGTVYEAGQALLFDVSYYRIYSFLVGRSSVMRTVNSANNVVAFKMTSTKAKQLLVKIADCSKNIIFTKHALARMKQRKITPPQVINCLRKGGGCGTAPSGSSRDLEDHNRTLHLG